MRLFQIGFCLGAGNIGDEVMNRAFWAHCSPDCALDIAVHPLPKPLRSPYPASHRYVQIHWEQPEIPSADCVGAVLVGGTPVSETEGLHYPLGFLAPRLLALHQRGLPVDVVGAGVETLRSAPARRIFAEAFLPVRSWTVRTEACRQTLMDLGVDPSRVVVAADLAWLYEARRDLDQWAAAWWRAAGVDPARPLIVVNAVNMIWSHASRSRSALAAALDEFAARYNCQIAFYCNECRDGEYFDYAAAGDLQRLLRAPSVIAPNLYYTPDEAIALLGCAAIVVSQRYHTIVEAVMAATIPVCIARGEKIRGLAAELELEVAGEMENMETARLAAVLQECMDNRQLLSGALQARARQLARRSLANWHFLRRYYPQLRWPRL